MGSHGGDEGSRTPDLLNAIQALSQLSYIPTHGAVVKPRLVIIRIAQDAVKGLLRFSQRDSAGFTPIDLYPPQRVLTSSQKAVALYSCPSCQKSIRGC